jgi:hypothetical protein
VQLADDFIALITDEMIDIIWISFKYRLLPPGQNHTPIYYLVGCFT